jgi:hypothetical protein
MTDPTNRPPLWQVMRHASQHSRINWEHMDAFKYAAELRAIAYELIRRDHHGAGHWLLAEADRAEAGE